MDVLNSEFFCPHRSFFVIAPSPYSARYSCQTKQATYSPLTCGQAALYMDTKVGRSRTTQSLGVTVPTF